MKGETSGFVRNEIEPENPIDDFAEPEDTLENFEVDSGNSGNEFEDSRNEFVDSGNELVESGNEFENLEKETEHSEDGFEKSEITNGMRGAITGEIAAQQQRQAERTRRSRPIRETVREVRERVMEREADFTTLRPAQEKVCDRNHLVDQRIIVTDAEDLNRTDFRFKLTERDFLRLVDDFKTNGATASGTKVTSGKMMFESSKPKDDNPRGILEDFRVCNAYVFERENEAGEKMKVFVAEPREIEDVSLSSMSTELVRAAIGLVKIEAPREMSPEATEELLDQIMTEDFGIPDALEDVTVEDENDYKLVEFAKRIGKSPNKLTDAERERALSMKRVEIYPGYTDLMDEGRHFEIEDKFGKIYVIHTMHTGNVDSVERLLKQGLLCSAERYARGVTVSGLSSLDDFYSGGADYVFTRAMPEEELERVARAGTVVVFKDELLDWMMTWYKSDQFGATDEETRKGLLSTEQLLEIIDERKREGLRCPRTNEGMQPLGIGPQLIDQILVDTEHKRRGMIDELKRRGVDEFDGRPIEEVIVRMSSEEDMGEEIVSEIQDGEVDEVLAQADKEIEQMLAMGILPSNDEFFDDFDDDSESDFGSGDNGKVDIIFDSENDDSDDDFDDKGYDIDGFESGVEIGIDSDEEGYNDDGFEDGIKTVYDFGDEDYGDELLGEDVSLYDY